MPTLAPNLCSIIFTCPYQGTTGSCMLEKKALIYWPNAPCTKLAEITHNLKFMFQSEFKVYDNSDHLKLVYMYSRSVFT